MITAFPTQGSQYVVQVGDTLTAISTRAYGIPNRANWIWKANQKSLRSGNPDLIYPGEVIDIPTDPTKTQAVTAASVSLFAANPKNSCTFVVDGRQIPVVSARLSRSLDTMVDQFTAEIPWTYGLDTELDKRVAPYAYPPATVYLGPNLALTGRLYIVKASKKTDGTTKVLEAFSSTVDLVDSTMSSPYFFRAAYMDTLARSVVSAFGLPITFNAGRGAYFQYGIEAKSTETVGKFLERIAFQSGQLVGNDEKGGVIFGDAKALAKLPPVGTLNEAEPWGRSLEIEFNGRERFNSYTALGWEGDGAPVVSVAKDSVVPKTRRINFVVDDNDPGTSKITAAWKRSKQLIKTLTIPIPLTGWYNPQGNLWAPGQMVTIKSTTLHCPNGFTFLIRSTEHVMENGGFTCTLNVCPAQALTGEDLKEPWVVK